MKKTRETLLILIKIYKKHFMTFESLSASNGRLIERKSDAKNFVNKLYKMDKQELEDIFLNEEFGYSKIHEIYLIYLSDVLQKESYKEQLIKK